MDILKKIEGILKEEWYARREYISKINNAWLESNDMADVLDILDKAKLDKNLTEKDFIAIKDYVDKLEETQTLPPEGL